MKLGGTDEWNDRLGSKRLGHDLGQDRRKDGGGAVRVPVELADGAIRPLGALVVVPKLSPTRKGQEAQGESEGKGALKTAMKHRMYVNGR
jgi:hypothetical protein